jgi:hypothetical protein
MATATSEAARVLGVPLRHAHPGVRYCGDFYGQTSEGVAYPEGIAVERLLTILSALPPGPTELVCHPGDDLGLATMYRRERLREVRVLCDPRVWNAAAAGIELLTFRDVTPVGTRVVDRRLRRCERFQ